MANAEIEAVMGDQNKMAKGQRESVINDNALAVNNGVLSINKLDLEKATGSLASQFTNGMPKALESLLTEKAKVSEAAETTPPKQAETVEEPAKRH